MDSNESKQRLELRAKHTGLVTYLKANGFKWESEFRKERYMAETFSFRPFVVKLIWDHKPEE